MKQLIVLLTFIPNIIFAANFYWFEQVSEQLKEIPGIDNVSYQPGVNDSNFKFTKAGKEISVWVNFGHGNNAVYGFTNLISVNSEVTIHDGKLIASEGNMLDTMQALRRRGNFTAGNLDRSVEMSKDGQKVELQSTASGNGLNLTIIKLKEFNGSVQDVHISFGVTGTDQTEEALDAIKLLRPLVEKQIGF